MFTSTKDSNPTPDSCMPIKVVCTPNNDYLHIPLPKLFALVRRAQRSLSFIAHLKLFFYYSTWVLRFGT